jgi:very-short-patch-repair endonuclease
VKTKYEARLDEYQAELKKRQTRSEVRLKEILVERYGKGKISAQVLCGWFFIDLLFGERMLGIELDGPSHDERKEYDDKRDRWIGECGITIIRFPNRDVWNNIDAVLRRIDEFPFVDKGGFTRALFRAKRKRRIEQAEKLAERGLGYNSKGRVMPLALAQAERKRREDSNRARKRRNKGKPPKRQTKTKEIEQVPEMIVRIPLGRTKHPDGSTSRRRCPNCDTGVSSRWVRCRGCCATIEFHKGET